MKYIALVCTLLLMFAVTAWGAPSQNQKQDDQAALQRGAKISMAQAEKIALAKEPGTIKSKELEKEHGKVIYSFDIRTKSGIREVNIDARSGDIVEDKLETKADEAKEKQQDLKKRRATQDKTPPSSPQ